jgi:hypothetical protein
VKKVSFGKRAGKSLTSSNWPIFGDGETEFKGDRTRKENNRTEF